MNIRRTVFLNTTQCRIVRVDIIHLKLPLCVQKGTPRTAAYRTLPRNSVWASLWRLLYSWKMWENLKPHVLLTSVRMGSETVERNASFPQICGLLRV